MSISITAAKAAQFSVVAEKAGPEDLELAEEKESVQEKLVPAVAGEMAPSPEGLPTKEDIDNITEVPVLTGVPVSPGPDEAVSQESAPRELLVAAPQEYSEDDAGFADKSPEDTEVDALSVAVESESPDQHHVEEPVQIAPIPVIPMETSEDGAPEEHAEGEAAPRQTLLIVPDDNTEVEPDASQEPPPETPEEEKTADLVPAETEIEEADQDKFVVEETAPEEPAVIDLEEPAKQEADTEKQGETVHFVFLDTKEAPEHDEEEEDAFFPVVLEENAEEDPAVEEPEGESVVLFPAQFEDQVEPAADKTAPQESGSEGLAVIVPVDPSEEESKQEEQVIEETILLVSSVEQEKIEAPEGDTEAEPLVTVVPADVETNEEAQEKTATQESAPEIAVLLEPTSEEPAPEDLIFIVSLEDPDEEISEDYAEEEVQSDPHPQEPALEGDDNEPDDSDPDILIVSVTETTSETETTVLDPVEKVPVAATEILTEASVESVTSPAPPVTDAEVESVPVSVESVSVTGVTTHSDDFKAAGIPTEDESAGKN